MVDDVDRAADITPGRRAMPRRLPLPLLGDFFIFTNIEFLTDEPVFRP